MDVTFAMQHEVRNKKKGLKAEKNGWWRRGSNSRGIAPIGNQEILKSDALDQLGHATLTSTNPADCYVRVFLPSHSREHKTTKVIPSNSRCALPTSPGRSSHRRSYGEPGGRTVNSCIKLQKGSTCKHNFPRPKSTHSVPSGHPRCITSTSRTSYRA